MLINTLWDEEMLCEFIVIHFFCVLCPFTVSGNMYEYNSRTGARKWKKPLPLAPGVVLGKHVLPPRVPPFWGVYILTNSHAGIAFSGISEWLLLCVSMLLSWQFFSWLPKMKLYMWGLAALFIAFCNLPVQGMWVRSAGLKFSL